MKGLSIIVSCGMLSPFAGFKLDAAAKAVSTPMIISVSPSHIFNDQAMTITIEGAGFADTPIVTASTCYPSLVVLSNVTFVNSTTITATVPADLPEGVYNITVINPDGQRTDPYKHSYLTIMRRGDETYGLWKSTSTMTTERWRFAAVEDNGYLYAIGGNGYDSGVVLASVERAKINPDGSLGPWQVISALNAPRAGLAGVAVNNHIYAIGGEANSFVGPKYDTVERAAINPDGSLGPWQASSSMMTPRVYPSAVATGGYLYAIGGGFPEVYTVERAAINPDGSLGPWEATASTNIARPIAAAYGDYIYAMGGENSVERARVNPDGSLEPWQIISSMTVDRSEFAAVAAKGYLYALGSFYPCIYSTNSVERAAINSDGSLGPWELTASMQEGRSMFTAVVAERRIYALGGYTNWGGGTGRSVEFAAIGRYNSIFMPLIRR